MGGHKGKAAGRLEARSDRSGGPSACWTWRLSLTTDGYGKLTVGGRRLLAHRVAWEAAHGPIPDGMVVMHECDNPACTNPAHLRLGTHADNRADCVRKGRHAKGSVNGRAKLVEADIPVILAELRAGRTKAGVARERGVDRAVIRRIAAGTLWRHALRP